jgi:hypothetical protein
MEKGPAILDSERTWLEKTLFSFLSYKDEDDEMNSPDSRTPQEMIDSAAARAFRVSTVLGLIPGPVGIMAILPEVVAITKIQINLIHRIARYHGKSEEVNLEMVLLILGNVFGVAAGEALTRKAGTALVIRSVNSRLIKQIARRIGNRMVDTVAEKAIGRWIPMMSAPLFGYLSKSLTRRIGREANRLLTLDLEIDGPEVSAG